MERKQAARPAPRPAGFEATEAREATMSTLCPSAFDENPFAGFKDASPPEPPSRAMAAEVATGVVKPYDPSGRLKGAREVDEATARLKSKEHPGRVLSVVMVGPGAGGEAYGASPMDVVVPGYRPNAKAYYLEARS
jgi:hypothetical protein